MWLVVVLAGAVQALPAIDQCPVTTAPAQAFVPPAPYPVTPPDRLFWFGTPQLWTRLPQDGRSAARDKSFWWSPAYDSRRESRPDLRITATSLATRFAAGITAIMGRATNASAAEFGGWTMLTMLEFPAAGCWRVTATYDGQSVTFVTFVSD